MLRQHRLAQLCLLFFLGLSLSTFTIHGQQPRPLELDKTVETDLGAGEKQSFQVSLTPLDFARLEVTAKDVGLLIGLFAPDGKPVVEYQWNQDSPDTANVSLIAGLGGNYRLELTSQEKESKKISVKLTELRGIGQFDPERIEAERQFAKGEQLRPHQAADDKKAALAAYTEALKQWRVSGDKEKQAMVLSSLGDVSRALREHQQALDYFNQALTLRRELKNRKGEANALTNLAQTYQAMGQSKQALEYFNQALPVMREVENQRGEAIVITSIGATQAASGERQQAIESFAQARPVWQKLGDQSREAEMFVRTGRTYEAMNDKVKALEAYAEALKVYRTAKDQIGEANTLLDLGVVNQDRGNNRQALEFFEQALPIWRSLNRKREEASTLNFIGRVRNTLGDKQLALETYNQALSLAREVGNRGLEATVLNNMATIYFALGEKRRAAEAFDQVLPLRRAANDKLGEASTLTNIGAVYADWGESLKALDYYNQALPLWREAKRADGEVSTIINIGEAYDLLGEKQKSLDYYAQALNLARTIGARQNEGVIQTSLATVYSSLGEKEKARDMYMQALEIHRSTGNRTAEGDTLHLLGFLHYELEDFTKALDYMSQEAVVWRQLKDVRAEGVMLGAMGMVYRKLGDRQKSLEVLNQALPLDREVGNRQGEVDALINIGLIESDSGEKQKALENFNHALEISRAVSDPTQEANARYEIARIKLELGELSESRSQIEDTLNIVESLRTKVASQELRASYFATVQKYYDFYIELLMQMNGRQSGQGFGGEALQASERARARSLLEILAEANASIHEGVDPALLNREQTLHHQLSGKADALARLYASRPSPEQIAAAKKEVDDLTAQYNEVRAEIRRASPRYASLTQPTPLNLKEIQQQVLDADTLLLEYWLGEKRSFLWAVTPTKISSYVLPPRAKLEAEARNAYEWVSKPAQANAKRRLKHDGVEMTESERKARGLQAMRYLSNTLIKPVAPQLGKKRLVIVASGALQYVPFAALSVAGGRSSASGKKAAANRLPTPNSRLLIQDHEIINLPSASTMAVLRRDTEQRQVAPKMLAVLADPVFEKDDERVGKMARPTISASASQPKESTKTPPQTVAEERSLKHMKEKSAEETGEMKIARLPFTRQEAEKILALVPEAERKEALDFDANRTTAMAKDLSQYRYVHFATHGYLDSERPEFSALVLSLVDKEGVQQSGFLYAYEVYNLQLNSDVVVLSACETGLGKEIRGEGLVGLTRGFMYAGAPRVVVSLWSVNDRATADLMTRFYRNMLKDKLPAAAALRAAQIEMLKESQWREPYYWAAFALQGEWR
ncbi:MAG: tetratricopeptide repeat protein [Acidobacteria bacterium]|nr:tetratricopeptide repeat protein [Acidobacteriota bacterium]